MNNLLAYPTKSVLTIPKGEEDNKILMVFLIFMSILMLLGLLFVDVGNSRIKNVPVIDNNTQS